MKSDPKTEMDSSKSEKALLKSRLSRTSNGSFPRRFQAIKTAEWFDKSWGAVLTEVVKVRANVID